MHWSEWSCMQGPSPHHLLSIANSKWVSSIRWDGWRRSRCVVCCSKIYAKIQCKNIYQVAKSTQSLTARIYLDSSSILSNIILLHTYWSYSPTLYVNDGFDRDNCKAGAARLVPSWWKLRDCSGFVPRPVYRPGYGGNSSINLIQFGVRVHRSPDKLPLTISSAKSLRSSISQRRLMITRSDYDGRSKK